MPRNVETNIFIADQSIGFFQYQPKSTYESKFGTLPISSGIIENGYIKDPEGLLLELKTLFSNFKIKPKRVRMVIHDQNVLIRQIEIDKKTLGEQKVDDYIKAEKGKSIQFPFEHAAVTHMVREETEELIKVIAIIADEDLLQDYYDVFDRLKVKQVRYDLSSSALYHTYLKNKREDFKDGMFVSLYDGFLSIQIIENKMPIFSMTEEYTGKNHEVYDLAENFIERIANYYRYNMRKNMRSIKRIVIYDFAESLNREELQEKVADELKEFEVEIFDSIKENPVLKDMPKLSLIAFASGISQEFAADEKLEISVVRRSKKVLYANYVLVLAFAVMTALLVFYVPYLDLEQQIILQQNRNNALQNQLEGLIREVPEPKTWTETEKNYSNAYDLINPTRTSPSQYFHDLNALIHSDIFLEEFVYIASEKKITLRISAASEVILYEYALLIYEEYGTLGTPTIDRWMIREPGKQMVFNLIMEVVIYHA